MFFKFARMMQALFLTSLVCVSQPSVAQVPVVSTDIAPVHSLVASVMGKLGEPDLILQNGASAHSNDLRPSAARALGRADIVFWMGPTLTPWLAKPVESIAGGARIVSLLAANETALLPLRQPADFALPQRANAEGPSEVAVADSDPHAWLHPENAIAWLDLIAGELAALDPEHTDAYGANAAAAKTVIRDELAPIRDQLAARQDTAFILYHDAFQYFERRFALVAATAISLGDAADPGPAHLAKVRDLVSERAISCVFAEPQYNAGILNTVFEGRTPKVIVLDVMGAGLKTGPSLYPQLLRELAAGFSDCD